MFKKKITKQSLAELAKVMPVVPEWEMNLMVGGEYKNYTIEEYESMLDSGTWKGGYVNGVYAGTYNPSYTTSGITGSTGNHAIPPVDSGLITGINPIDGWGEGGTSGEGGSTAPSLMNKAVLGKVGFVGYNPNDPSGCMRRCQEMLAKTNTFLNGTKVGMVNINNGEIIGKSTTYQQGVNAINNSLLNGKPVIVGVDYKLGSPNSDGVTDHFIVIVGVNQTQTSGGIQTTYQFFDPATSQASYGTSSDNTLTVTSNGIIGTYLHTDGSLHSYRVTDVRLNK